MADPGFPAGLRVSRRHLGLNADAGAFLEILCVKIKECLGSWWLCLDPPFMNPASSLTCTCCVVLRNHPTIEIGRQSFLFFTFHIFSQERLAKRIIQDVLI